MIATVTRLKRTEKWGRMRGEFACFRKTKNIDFFHLNTNAASASKMILTFDKLSAWKRFIRIS